MTRRSVVAGLVVIVAGVGLTAQGAGCAYNWLKNQTTERTGNITMAFINTTPYRASFSYGVWDAWDRDPPGPMQFLQTRLNPLSTHTPEDGLTCARNFAVATAGLLQRALDNDEDDQPGFDADAFDVLVHFSDAPADSDLAAVATVGTARGVEKLLGVDFTCADQLVFTFVEDPAALGGFRIDFEVIPSE